MGQERIRLTRRGPVESAPFEMLYEDADIIAVAKPAGVTVIPGRNERPADALRGRLEAQRKEHLWVVHRIDRDTSGVVLFARNERAHRTLSMAFESREVSKTYLAWTRGRPAPLAGTITLALHTARKSRMRPAAPGEPDSLPSETDYRVLVACETALGPVACVEARPRTGRQHQLRVHLRAAGAPLLVDPLYGRSEDVTAGQLGEGSPALSRLTLHAAAISFRSPACGDVTVTAPLPADLSALAGWLGGTAAG